MGRHCTTQFLNCCRSTDFPTWVSSCQTHKGVHVTWPLKWPIGKMASERSALSNNKRMTIFSSTIQIKCKWLLSFAFAERNEFPLVVDRVERRAKWIHIYYWKQLLSCTETTVTAYPLLTKQMTPWTLTEPSFDLATHNPDFRAQNEQAKHELYEKHNATKYFTITSHEGRWQRHNWRRIAGQMKNYLFVVTSRNTLKYFSQNDFSFIFQPKFNTLHIKCKKLSLFTDSRSSSTIR